MPHLILEHSSELSESHDITVLMDAVFDLASAHPVFAAAPAAVKVRSIACANVRSGLTPETFAHLTVKMLSGRSTEAKAGLAEDLLRLLHTHLTGVGSLSVEPVDMEREVYRKRAL
ncbi:5-carboxymethyl-2-hydroxymuconate isomerase [Shimia thalassica]|uniref:5-carboxymethyl-2-hydroxymuconate Delta-isomerase n=1 Tax=Shimia thalassica TaxID=1715693 RepID=UPI001C09FDF3|nr:5-carboxymethyl-2-hydroxymuconate isomerase [Shimia thalassica]MBU2943300.1 5-carboxymethyl-2-hydroxymuconate isomerase [Shimia thalassica]MDO6501369.1 5-carboxymethyl-2-hydroxymuconate isomerase [Shimia thalassica]